MNNLKWLTERESNLPRDHPKSFYTIEDQGDGTCDVYLFPYCSGSEECSRASDYRCGFLVVRGIIPFDGMEEDIRRRFYAWVESGRYITAVD